MIIVYIPCKDKQEAEKIVVALLEKKLIACANRYTSESNYWWNNKIESKKETVILAKTLPTHYNEIEKQVMKLHSYQCPCILRWNIEGNKEFVKWVSKEVKMN